MLINITSVSKYKYPLECFQYLICLLMGPKRGGFFKGIDWIKWEKVQIKSSTGTCVVGRWISIVSFMFSPGISQFGCYLIVSQFGRKFFTGLRVSKFDYNSAPASITSTHTRYCMDHSYLSQNLHGSMSPIKPILSLNSKAFHNLAQTYLSRHISHYSTTYM